MSERKRQLRRKGWTEEHTNEVIELYNSGVSIAEIFAKFNKYGYSVYSTRAKIANLRLNGLVNSRTISKADKKWTDEAVERLIYLYNNHTHNFITSEMEKLGIYKTATTLKIKDLKVAGRISVRGRLDLESREENDAESRLINTLQKQGVNTTRKRVREILRQERLKETWRV